MKNQTKTLTLFIALFIAISNLYAADFAGGNGTADDPFLISTPEHLNNIRYYTGKEHADKHFKLTNDIDLGVAPYNEGEGWKPIGDTASALQASFHGSGYIVKNLFINRPDDDYQSLFGMVKGGIIDSLGIENCDITGKNHVSALCSGDTLIYCYSSGTVKGWDYVGGLLSQGKALNSYSSCTVSGRDYVGGLFGVAGANNCYATGNISGYNNVGGLGAGSAVNCYATGNVSGYICVGGLLGGGDAINCYATGNVTGVDTVGGLVGVFNNPYAAISNNVAINLSVSGFLNTNRVLGFNRGSYIIKWWSYGLLSNNHALNTEIINGNIIINGKSGNVNGEDKTLEELQSQATYEALGWDFDSTWKMNAANEFPVLQWQAIPDNLPAAGIMLNKKKIQLLAGYSDTLQARILPNSATNKKVVWTSSDNNMAGVNSGIIAAYKAGEVIITATTEDGGYYDTCSVIIYNFAGGDGTAADPYLISTREQLNAVRHYTGEEHADKHFRLINDINLGGLTWHPITPFHGKFHGGGFAIRNLSTTNDLSITNQGLFGTLHNAVIDSLGLINCNVTGNKYIGSLAGSAYGCVITSCYAKNGTIQAHASEAGGLIAINEKGTITNCYTDIEVRGFSNSAGFIAINKGQSTITNCYSLGDVKAIESHKTSSSAGEQHIVFDVGSNISGFIAGNASNVTKCYSSGNVSGYASVHGFIGYNGGSITECYTNAYVAVSALGGVCANCSPNASGFVGNNFGSITNCYSTGYVSTKMPTYFLDHKSYSVGAFVSNNSGTILKCYTTADITMPSAAGAMSIGSNASLAAINSDSAIISNSVAGSQFIATIRKGRVTTNEKSINLSNNYALDSMKLGYGTDYGYDSYTVVTDGTHDNQDGENRSIEELQSQATYEALGWDFDSTWTMAEFPVKPSIGTLAGETVRLPRLKWQPEPTQNIHDVPQRAIASIRLYPNPSNEMLTISSIDNKIFKSISLFDMAGKLLAAYSSIDNSIYTIDISQYPVGTYMLNIDGKTVRFVKK